jgi:hypothetical protein
MPDAVVAAQTEEIVFHLVKCPWPSVHEVSERLPESKHSASMERPKHDAQWIELTVTPKVIERHLCHRKSPMLSLRPIQDNRTFAELRYDVALDVVMPDRAVRINEQNVPSPEAPPRPDEEVQEHRADDEKNKGQQHRDEDEWGANQTWHNHPIRSFAVGVRNAHVSDCPQATSCRGKESQHR